MNRAAFPSALEAVFLVIMLFVAEYVINAALYDLRLFAGADADGAGAVVTVLANGLLFSVVLHYKGMSYRELIHPSSQPFAATVATLTAPVLLIVPGLALAVGTVEGMLEWAFPLSARQEAYFAHMMSNDVVMLIAACILAPVLEEMLFRGIILRGFLQQYPRRYAILGSAALFGMAHLNLYQFAVGLGMGLVLGWLYERARSLWPCMLLHAAYNSTGLWLTLGASDADGAAQSLPADYWIGAFVLAFAGTARLRRAFARAGEAA